LPDCGDGYNDDDGCGRGDGDDVSGYAASQGYADDAGYTGDDDGAVPLPQRGGAGYGLYDDDVYDLLSLPRFFSFLDSMHPVR